MSAETRQTTLEGTSVAPEPDQNLALAGRFLKQADPNTDIDNLGQAFRSWIEQQGTNQ